MLGVAIRIAVTLEVDRRMFTHRPRQQSQTEQWRSLHICVGTAVGGAAHWSNADLVRSMGWAGPEFQKGQSPSLNIARPISRFRNGKAA